MCSTIRATAVTELNTNSDDNTGEGLEEITVEFDVKNATLANIKLMLGSSAALDYGPLYVITPPAQIFIGEEYTLKFTWPRPPETDSSILADEKLPHLGGPLWLSATTDYDPDRAELKSVRGWLGREVILSGLICVERPSFNPLSTGNASASTEETSETYLVLWGLSQKSPPSAHQNRINHGELHSESVWCHVLAWNDLLDPSLAPLAHDILQLDLGSILVRIQNALLLTGNDLKEKCTVTQSSQEPASEITAQVWCLDFFGQETLRLRVGSSHTEP